jgi:Ca-activated chloride channel homolog
MTSLLPTLEPVGPSLAWGSLNVSEKSAKKSTKRSLPLAAIKIRAKVAAQVAEVMLEQVFENNLTQALEAIYVFPLPGAAAISHFSLQAGERTIVAQIKERGQARQDYQQALHTGHRAALLEQEREGVFTISLGNILPGERLAVKVSYSQVLPLSELGLSELRLPLVVAPRYLPGELLDGAPTGRGTASDTDRVPDASRISPPLLAPGFDPRVDFSLQVQLLESQLESLSCSQHAIQMAMGSEGVTIELSREHERLNRDFVLRWRQGQAALSAQLLYTPWEEGYFGLLQLNGPSRSWAGVPREVVFVLDRSGSMEGEKMVSASQACGLLLEALGPSDRFAILAFDDQLDWFKPSSENPEEVFLAADPAGQEKGLQFLQTVTARGGTELEGALKSSLKALQRDSESLRQRVVVLLTDGQIGDESAVLRRLQESLGDCRVFAIGIDTAVNEALLNRLASLGGGSAHFVVPGERLNDALRGVAQEMGDAALSGIEINLAEGELQALAPARIPDLFSGRGLSLCFRSSKAVPVQISGQDGQAQKIQLQAQPREIELDALRHLWARRRLTELEDRFRLSQGSDPDLRQEMIQVSCEHGVLSRLTAMLAIDQAEIANPSGQYTRVAQPVELPDQWAESTRGFTGALPPPAMAAPPPCPSPMPMAMPMDACEASLDEYEEVDEAPENFMQSPSRALYAAQAPAKKGFKGIKNPFAKKAVMPAAPPSNQPMEAVKAKASHLAKAQSLSAGLAPELRAALESLLKLCAQICRNLQQDLLSPADVLQSQRLQILKDLSNSPQADRFPHLQRLLRRELLELLQGLQAPGIQAQVLLPLASKITAMLPEVEKELAGLDGANAEASEPASFWASSI